MLSFVVQTSIEINAANKALEVLTVRASNHRFDAGFLNDLALLQSKSGNQIEAIATAERALALVNEQASLKSHVLDTLAGLFVTTEF